MGGFTFVGIFTFDNQDNKENWDTILNTCQYDSSCSMVNKYIDTIKCTQQSLYREPIVTLTYQRKTAYVGVKSFTPWLSPWSVYGLWGIRNKEARNNKV